MRIIVTGALGHIGSSLIRHLPEVFPGVEIVMIDNLSTLRYPSLFDLPEASHYQFCELDVLSDECSALYYGADAVVHLAAITDAANSFNRPEQVEEVNCRGVVKVAEACQKHDVPLIFLSTTSVYGSQDHIVDEDCQELIPQSPYAESKLKAEKHLFRLGMEAGFPFTILRFGTICGVSPGMRFHTAVNRFCWQASIGEKLTVWQTAYNQKRPYLDLKDAVRAISFILLHKMYRQQLFNVVTQNCSVSEIVGHIQRKIPDLQVAFVDSAIMNQLSYDVSAARFSQEGFTFSGNVSTAIDETLALIGKLSAPSK